MTQAPIQTMYVSRTIPLPSREVARALPRLPATFGCNGKSLVLDDATRSRRRDWRLPRHSRSATLCASPAFFRFPVELEISAWSRDATEIAIRPVGRRCQWWPTRYCDAAHTMVEHVAGLTLFQALRTGAPLPAPGQLRRAS